MAKSEKKAVEAKISLNSKSYHTSAVLEFLPSGEVRPHFPEKLYDGTFDFVLEGFSKFEETLSNFTFEGISADGARFHTNRLILNSASTPVREGKTYTQLRGFFGNLVREATIDNPRDGQGVSYWMRGFENFGPYKKKTPLGTVRIAGSTKYTDYNNVGGYIGIVRSFRGRAISLSWEYYAREFLDYLHRVATFGRCCPLSISYCEAFRGAEAIKVFYNPRKNEKPFLSPIHFLNAQSFFDCCIDTYFRSAKEINKIKYAIDWLNEPQHYNELRLMVRMMALENVVENLLDETEKTRRFAKTEFRNVRDRLLSAVDTEDIDENDKEELKTALGNLNKLSLRDKVQNLIQKYQIPLDGLSNEKIRAAINARNDIVHRGVYYTAKSDEQDPLWQHIITMNELLVRLIFLLVGYNGMYTSWVDGMTHRSFPDFRKL